MTEVRPDKDQPSAVVQRLLSDVPHMRGPAPVHLWNPPFCGDIDMRIAANGTWHYNGSPITRLAMVKLFASILRKDDDRFVLVNPVERVGIIVEDAPFIAVELAREAVERVDILYIRTNLDDVVAIGHEHPIRFETAADGGLKPYIHVRGDLWALASRSLTHELIGLGTIEETNGGEGTLRRSFGIRSGEYFSPIVLAEDIEVGA